MNITVNDPNIDAISRFVRDCPNAAPGHDPAWLEILRHGLGHQPVSLTAWHDGQVIGWLPLALVKSFIFGKRLVSLPYVNEAGVLAEDALTAQALVDSAADIARREGAMYVELRNATPINADGLSKACDDKAQMTLELPTNADQLWDALPSKTRNLIRKAEKHSLETHWGGPELLDRFYDVLAVNMRDLGTPVFPKSLFAAILERGHAELCVITTKGRPICCALLTYFKNSAEVPSASSLRAFNHTSANMWMYWQLLQRAISRNATAFHFGRSTIDSGPYKFKLQWNAKPRPMGWAWAQATEQEIKPLRKEDSRYGSAIAIWKKLPVWLTRLAGPAIVRGIP